MGLRYEKGYAHCVRVALMSLCVSYYTRALKRVGKIIQLNRVMRASSGYIHTHTHTHIRALTVGNAQVLARVRVVLRIAMKIIALGTGTTCSKAH